MQNTTLHTTFISNIPVTVPNRIVAAARGFYVSYNNYDRASYGDVTTAIVVDHSGAFLILNGDHRAFLIGLDFHQVCDYFHSKPDLINFRSDKHEDDVFRIIDGKACILRGQSINQA